MSQDERLSQINKRLKNLVENKPELKDKRSFKSLEQLIISGKINPDNLTYIENLLNLFEYIEINSEVQIYFNKLTSAARQRPDILDYPAYIEYLGKITHISQGLPGLEKEFEHLKIGIDNLIKSLHSHLPS